MRYEVNAVMHCKQCNCFAFRWSGLQNCFPGAAHTAPISSLMKSNLNLCLCHIALLQRSQTCYPEGCAAPSFVPCQCNTQGSLSKLKGAPPQRKINVTCKSPVGDISVVTLIRTDTTLDHSQKAEKVCSWRAQLLCLASLAASKAFFRFSGAWE